MTTAYDVYIPEASGKAHMSAQSNPTLSDARSPQAVAESPCIVVGIGASAGGIGALKRFFQSMPANNGMAFVVVIHLSSEYTSNLAAILQGCTPLSVAEVTESLKIEPNHVYVIPPAKYLAMVDGEVRLTEPEETRGRRVPIDMFLRTLATAYGRKAMCVILSGTGSDGTLGVKYIKESGGITVAQDPAEAEYDGMPMSAIATNMVDLIMPVSEIPAKLVALKEIGDRLHAPANEVTETASQDDATREILTLLRVRTGHDFTAYKQPTIGRRLARRIQVHELPTAGEYLQYIRAHPEEIKALLSDLLITVTSFFRDKGPFEAFERCVVGQLFAGKTSADQVRVWIVGCATGEEAYSVAILLHEYATRLADPPKIQIFATDIDDETIAKARDCRYNETIAADVSPERLRQFFLKKGQSYIVKKELRNSILFALHNVLRDPPFSRIDLISCRNLLIYLNRDTQDLLLRVLHFALRQSGFLFLGSSESAEGAASLFAAVDKKNRIYRARPRVGHDPLPTLPLTGKWEIKTPDPQAVHERPDLSLGNLHHLLVEEYAPPSVLVNEEGEIIHLSQHAGRYLQLPGGQPSHNLFDLAPPALQLDLRSMIITAKQENRQIETSNLRVSLNGEERLVTLIVRPSLHASETTQELYLVIFDESRTPAAPRESPSSAQAALEGDKAMETVVRGLEQELQRTKDRLRATVEQHEISVEELKASNEELQAMNEELRSASEELETSKEELQSVNEELTTVNHELKETIDEVSRANSDLQNLISSTDIATIFLDRDLRVKRYTPRTQEIFNIIVADIGRPLEHVTHKLDYGNLAQDLAQVLETLQPIEREISTSDDRWYMVRCLPYRTVQDQIDGVAATFVDITERRKMEQNLREIRERFELAMQGSRDGIWDWNLMTDDIYVSERFFELIGWTSDDFAQGFRHSDWMSLIHPDDVESTRAALRRHLEKHQMPYSIEYRLRTKSGEYRWLSSRGQALWDTSGMPVRMSGSLTDITERKLAETRLRDTDRHKDEFLAMLSHELRNPLQVLCGALEVIGRSNDTEKTARLRQVAERQAGQLRRLIDDLLDVSRINAGKFELRMQRVDLASVVESALESSRPAIDDGGHMLTVALPPESVYLEADRARLAQALMNLLTNAAKYTAPGGHIWLSAAREGEQIVIRVRDNGRGIAPEILPRIFDMFAQVDTRRGGLGLGLALVKRFVERHGGEVSARSDGVGKGSEFIVRLPLAAEQQPLPQAQSGSATSNNAPTPRRVLVADAHVDAAEALAELLAVAGHTVRVASNGKTAIETARDFQPEVICLEIDLPDMNGFELAERLRSEIPGSLIVAVSSWHKENALANRASAAVDRYFLKPVKIDEISAVIAEAKSPPS
jgi:two-component system, chemotaxis family, CheB/CheR fusion protein